MQSENSDFSHNTDQSDAEGSTELAGENTELTRGSLEPVDCEETSELAGVVEDTSLDDASRDDIVFEDPKEPLESGSDGDSDLDIEEDESNGKVYTYPGD